MTGRPDDRDAHPSGPAGSDGPGRRAGAGRRPGRRLTWRRARDQLITIAWLVTVWSLWWGEFSWGNVVGGVLVATVVLVVFPLPPVTFEGRLRPLALAHLVVRFVIELVVASVQVGWAAVRPRYRLRNAIVGVRLRIPTDLNLTLTAEVLSLVPGTLIIETERKTGTLYLHVLNVRDATDVAAARTSTHALEARLVRAIGSPAELRELSTHLNRVEEHPR
ncbi:Na+/H+ antiporter subunit E [Micromonospora sp. HM5-17]|uniref:Na+/H+ antiporter subunit E n=1 Tax=Micromonospora sp. HM5-17 TaxID=2487710 RepID=UPI000F47FBB7|nr:Na+/H+ antiporter subunit E [Micromonospora sp. HM5-17]ROT32836.1 Na+/H+ antiporter subunit E [Micromonospora sp. HM5-17]